MNPKTANISATCILLLVGLVGWIGCSDENENGIGGGCEEEGYASCRRITINAARIAGEGALNDFPVLFALGDEPTLRTVANGGVVETEEGYDIVFKLPGSPSGELLDHELIDYDGLTGTLSAWVRVPTLSKTTGRGIDLYSGQAGAQDRSNPAGVWDSSFSGVWHLDEDAEDEESLATHADATSNENHGTQRGNAGTTGMIGGGQDFDGIDDYIEIENDAGLNPEVTITAEAWIKVGSFADLYWQNTIVGNADWTGGEGFHVGYDLRCGEDGMLSFTVAKPTEWPEAISEAVMQTDTWYHVAGTYDGVLVTVYINGAEEKSEPVTGNTPPSTLSLELGRCPGDQLNRMFHGAMDEVRISSVARSAEWIATSAANQSDPSSFYSVAEPVGGFIGLPAWR